MQFDKVKSNHSSQVALITAGVIDQQGMLTPPRHLIPPPVYPGAGVSPFISDLYFLLVF
jgi:hypothetical protein